MPISISQVPPVGTCVKIVTVNILQHETEIIGTVNRRVYQHGFVLGDGTWIFWKDNYPNAKPCYWIDLDKKDDDEGSLHKKGIRNVELRVDKIERLEILKKTK